MAYQKRDWDNTGTQVTQDDFKRIEDGIEVNDSYISEHDTKIQTNTELINVLKDSPDFSGTPTVQGQQIATTTKTPFYCTAISGYTISSQNCYIKGNRVHIDVSIQLNNGGFFNSTGATVKPISSPHIPIRPTQCSIFPWNGAIITTTIFIGTLFTDGIVYLVQKEETSSNLLQITCDFDI